MTCCHDQDWGDYSTLPPKPTDVQALSDRVERLHRQVEQMQRSIAPMPDADDEYCDDGEVYEMIDDALNPLTPERRDEVVRSWLEEKLQQQKANLRSAVEQHDRLSEQIPQIEADIETLRRMLSVHVRHAEPA